MISDFELEGQAAGAGFTVGGSDAVSWDSSITVTKTNLFASACCTVVKDDGRGH
jgi:hypothetical protein